MVIIVRALFTAALILVFLTSWIFLPAPNRPLLLLAVGAPEVSAWLALAGLVICVLTLGAGGRDTLTSWTFVLAAAATVAATVPLARLPFVARRFDATMRTALGGDFLRDVPAGRRAGMRTRPVALLDLFRGFTAGDTRVTRGVRFGAPGGVALTLDVYRPADGTRHPSIVQIYGGAWQRGAPGDDPVLAQYLASRGYVVFAIDYRHAPRWQFPAQIEDVRTALAWVRAHGGEHGADTSRLALIGRSAGAHLAMLAAYQPEAAVSAVVSFYGPVDLTEGYRRPPRPDPLDTRSIEEAFLGGTPDQMPQLYREASPISLVTGRVPPSLLIYGSRDHVVLPRFAALLDARLRAAGATSVFLEIPWAEHAFDAVAAGPSAQLAMYYTERFLAWSLTRDMRA